MNEDIKGTFEDIRKSYRDCAIALSLVQPTILGNSDNITIDKTSMVNAMHVIRDALLHRATLSALRIYDPNTNHTSNRDRQVCDKLFRLIRNSNTSYEELEAIEKIYSNIKESNNFKELKDIRNGRIAHSLTEKGADNLYSKICKLHNETLPLIEKLELYLLQEKDKNFSHSFWNETGRRFWKCIFIEGGKYTKK
jgi:hypothetical protein